MKSPPFCPYSGCDAHFHPRSTHWFSRRGTYSSLRSGPTQRYLCLCCGRSFSDASFSIDYFARRRIDYSRLLGLLVSCTGIRQMGRNLGVHRQVIVNRIMRLARQSLSCQCSLMRPHRLSESVVADGLRSFWISQYVPNEFLVLLGKQSRFLYAFCAYSLRRSGRMTPRQRERRDHLEQQFRASPKATERGFACIIEELTRICSGSSDELIELHTDEHQAYPRALGNHGGWRVLSEANQVVHVQTNSKKARTAKNKLAVVNGFDRSVRNDLAEHVRETIRFARSVGASQDRFAVYQHWHNYRKRGSIDESRHEERTHGEMIGFEAKELRRAMRGFFTRRVFYTRHPPWGAMRDVWLRLQRTPFLGRADYLPAHLVA